MHGEPVEPARRADGIAGWQLVRRLEPGEREHVAELARARAIGLGEPDLVFGLCDPALSAEPQLCISAWRGEAGGWVLTPPHRTDAGDAEARLLAGVCDALRSEGAVQVIVGQAPGELGAVPALRELGFHPEPRGLVLDL